ncbi:MAG: hypothetical protein AB7D92_10450, partial [Sphaerochaeta sp.]
MAMYGENDKETNSNTIARIVTYIEEVSDAHPSVILVDNGDVIQGDIMSDDLYNKREGDQDGTRGDQRGTLAYLFENDELKRSE